MLGRRGRIERDIENAWLAFDDEAGPMDDLVGHPITCRIAVGPRTGQKLYTLQTAPPRLPRMEGDANGAARAGGFPLHAGGPELQGRAAGRPSGLPAVGASRDDAPRANTFGRESHLNLLSVWLRFQDAPAHT